MSHNPLLDKPVLVLDGGLGTTLEDEHGFKFTPATMPLWASHTLVEQTETLRTVQRDFAEAGAEIILTATYQASFRGFKKTLVPNPNGIERERAQDLMLSAVGIARDAFAGRPGLVALSFGPYGATMVPGAEYSGKYEDHMDEDALLSFHQERLAVFTRSPSWKDVDIVAFETLPRLDEVRAVRRSMQSASDKPYWIACVFPGEGESLPDGSSIKEVVKTAISGPQPPYAIGINCTKVEKLQGLISAFERGADDSNLTLPRLVIYPDGARGQVYDPDLHEWIGDAENQPPWDAQVFEIVQEVRRRGKWQGVIVGGCCKATPQHIRSLKTALGKLD
jgi:homocysteine S-methyltransferase